MSLANVKRVIQRNTVPEARAAFARALELSERLGNQSGRFQALFGLAQYHMTDAELAQADRYCRQAIAVAEGIADEASLIRSYLMFGFICLIRGEFLSSKESMERVNAHYTSNLAEPLTTLQGQDTGVMANIYLACVLWFLGYPEQSDQTMARAQAIAEDVGLPLNLAFVCFYQMLLSLLKHDVPAAGGYADRLVTMSVQYDIGFTLIAGRVARAYVAAAADPTNETLREAFEGLLTLYHEQVSRLSQPFFRTLRVRLLIAAERYDEAHTLLTGAVELVQTVDDRYTASEVFRVQGELWTITGAGDPEKTFLQAIGTAREQASKMFQLRATVSLCRLWQRQGKGEEAYALLREIHDWFSEGNNALEMVEARELLMDLAPAA